jgi:phosphopantothenoylcysteine decarboxylase/phosphopantothenate--cysteine ligase
MLKNKNVLLGVTGGIAVYKAVDLVSRLIKEGATVDVVMTDAAAKYVSPLTFQTMAQSKVHTDMFGLAETMEVEHISLAKRADIIVIAPATANTIAKIANGIADNMLTTVVLASTAKIIFAPAMNTNMFLNPITQENIKKLEGLGHLFIPPGEGRLACGDVGPGKMAEPSDIIEFLGKSFKDQDLTGKKIVVTAGPTIEPLDPVRFITNHSSGKMGYAIAKEAASRGAETILISGPTNLSDLKGVTIEKITTAIDMLEAVGRHFEDCDVLVKAAAPSDFRPENFSESKIKKTKDSESGMTVSFIKNPDIAAFYGSQKKNQIIVGFAAETDNLVDYARRKLIDKNLDFVVANDVTMKGAGFIGDTNIATIISRDGTLDSYPLMSKDELAEIIIDKIKAKLENRF